MRLAELLTYFLGVCLAVAYGLQEFLVCFILVGVMLLVFILGAIFEGVRFIQWFFFIAFVSQIILIVMDVYSVIALIIFSSFLAISITYCIFFGFSDFARVRDKINKAPF